MPGDLQQRMSLGSARVYWQGPHAAHRVSGRPFQSPLGKLHSEGLALLRGLGWEQVPADDPRLPAFALTTRKGADFPASGPGLPQVRQFPQRCTAVLDDKRLMAECLEAAGCAHITPRTWLDVETFLQHHNRSAVAAEAAATEQTAAGAAAGEAETAVEAETAAARVPSSSSGGSGGSGGPGSGSSASQSTSGLWFLKHIHGVKGQAVYPFTSLELLLGRLRSLSSSSREQFIVQQGVAPPLLLHGRKFTLRAHVLVVLQHSDCRQRGLQQQELQEQEQEQQRRQQCCQSGLEQGEQQQGSAALVHAYVHEDVIVQEHARPYCAAVAAAPSSPSASAGSAGVTAGSAGVAAGSTGVAAAATGAATLEAAGAAGAAGAPSTMAAVKAAEAAEADPWVHVSSQGRGHPRPYLLSQLNQQQVCKQQQHEQYHEQQHQHHQAQQQQQEARHKGQQLAQLPPSQQQGHRQQQGQSHVAQLQQQGHRQQQGQSHVAQLQQQLWQQVCDVSRAAVTAAAQAGLAPAGADPGATLYHLFAFDMAVQHTSQAEASDEWGEGQPLATATGPARAGGPGGSAAAAAAAAPTRDRPDQQQQRRQQAPRVLLLEANSYPAIASGTMAAVPPSVYTRLIGDLARLVVLPALAPAQPDQAAAAGTQASAGAGRNGFCRVI